MGRLRRFFLPKLDRTLLVRVAVIAFAAYIIFGHILIPVVLSGHSMEPTYHDGRMNFCRRFSNATRHPERGMVVCIRWVGRKRMLLKRIVALEGQTVEFKNGTLFVDDKPVKEPYVVNKCDWNLQPWKVTTGSIYVVGDNRAVPTDEHVFGEVSKSRIEGTPLW